MRSRVIFPIALFAIIGFWGWAYRGTVQSRYSQLGARSKRQETRSAAWRTPQSNNDSALLIESKGLKEFSSANDTVDPVSDEDKQLLEEISPILATLGKQPVSATHDAAVVEKLDNFIRKHPDYPDAYILRATGSVAARITDYQLQLADVDSAIKYHALGKHATVFESSGSMYCLRAKIDIRGQNYEQALHDMEMATRKELDAPTSIFNAGGVKPEDSGDPTALQKNDFDLLVSQNSKDYRTYMFRGLFYAFYTTYDERFYIAALSDLQTAKELNPNSALVEYMLGMVYHRQASWSKAAWRDISESGGYRDKTNGVAIQHFLQSIQLDSTFAEAYKQVANALYNSRHYSGALSYYDDFIKLRPDDAGAYNDRGLAKTYVGDYYSAITDFGKSISLRKPKNDAFLYSSYENRGDASTKVGLFDNAIEDYSNAIGLQFGRMVFIMTLPQIRKMYPELGDLTDQQLLGDIRGKYLPNMSSETVSDGFGKQKEPLVSTVFANLYEKRGDAYLAERDFKKASLDYARARELCAECIDRWKVISKTAGSVLSIDMETLDFGEQGKTSMWVRIQETSSEEYSQLNFRINCSSRMISSGLTTRYDSGGKVVSTAPAQDWQSITPETVGETLYRSVCKGGK